MTPQDELAFVGDPLLFRPPADEVHISVAFTWDVEEGKRLRDAWADYYPAVKLGGPAIDGPNQGDEFIPGQYVRHGVTFTSRGCPYRCPWCLVPYREGNLRLLDIKPGWIVQDNNLLATPPKHQRAVYKMLAARGRAISFRGGLDSRLLNDWVADQLRDLHIGDVFLSADSWAALNPLERAVKRLGFLKRRQLRCYVLIGFGSETLVEAQRRLEAVWTLGCMPFAQLYQPPGRRIDYPAEWKALARTWSRPAAMATVMKRREEWPR